MYTEWLDKKHINLLSGKLKGFVWKSPNLANCRCPLCGDSASNERKARGYFISKKGQYYFYCHNSGCSSSIPNLLKRLDYRLYKQYQTELFESQGKNAPPEINFKVNTRSHFENHSAAERALKKLSSISQLESDHPAKQYMDARKIPLSFHSLFRWAPNFMTWTNTLVPGKFSKDALKHDQGRILIPFFSREGKFFAYTGRAIDSNSVRYILIVLDHEIPCICGINSVDFNLPVYVVEGPLDATFLPNCIAIIGSNVNALTSVGNNDIFVIIFDNEPEKPETKKKMLYCIEQGYRVCIWPRYIKEKDINEMVLAGTSPTVIQQTIDQNTFTGMQAKIRLEAWSKQ